MFLCYILKSWIGLPNVASGIIHILPNQTTPKILWRCLGLEFSVGSRPIFSLTDVPGKPSVSSSRDKYSHVNLISLLPWASFTDLGNERSQTYCGAVQVALGEHLKGSLLSLPHEGKWTLSETYTCQSFHESPWRWSTLAGTALRKHQSNTVTICK